MALQWAKPARRSPSSVWKRRAILAGLALVAGGAMAVLAMVHDRPDGNPKRVRVQVRRGVSLDGLVKSLHGRGLAPHPRVLYWTLRINGTLEGVTAGIHEFPGDATALELSDLLLRPPKIDGVQLTLRPGLTVWQAADIMADTGLGSVTEIVGIAADYEFARKHVGAALLGPPRPPRTDGFPPTYLEGFLAPDTYFVPPEAPPKRVLSRLIGQFQKVWRPLAKRFKADRLALRARYGVSDREIIIIASLVEREIADHREAARVAGVFYNRLERKMKLQTDPTLIYRPDRTRLKPTPVHRRDATNPYNTYAHRGLPPGPICSPSAAALAAALRPERHRYLYFVAKGGRRHAFATTYEAHKANVNRFLR